MKRLLFATALAAVSLTVVEANTGQGWYVSGQAGIGAFFLSGEGSFYTKNSNGVLEKLSADSGALPSYGLQFNWGYSHKFENNMTLGAEFAVLSPGVRLGYMVENKHHIVAGVHYAAIARALIATAVNAMEKSLSEAQKDNFDLKLTGASGLGASVAYEYFTPSKNFFRVQLRADYYGVEGKLGGVSKLGDSAFPFVIDGKGTAWDVTLYAGVGTQW